MKASLKNIITIVRILVSITIIIILYVQHNKIEKLKVDLSNCESVEYVNTRDTIKDVGIEYNNITAPSNPIYEREVKYLEAILSREDSIEITKAIINHLAKYNEMKEYSHVFKDDSSAYIRMETVLFQNELQEPTIIFENRFPAYRPIERPRKTEFYAGFGAYNKGITLTGGVLTKSKVFYQVEADVINRYYGGKISFKLF